MTLPRTPQDYVKDRAAHSALPADTWSQSTKTKGQRQMGLLSLSSLCPVSYSIVEMPHNLFKTSKGAPIPYSPMMWVLGFLSFMENHSRFIKDRI